MNILFDNYYYIVVYKIYNKCNNNNKNALFAVLQQKNTNVRHVNPFTVH